MRALKYRLASVSFKVFLDTAVVASSLFLTLLFLNNLRLHTDVGTLYRELILPLILSRLLAAAVLTRYRLRWRSFSLRECLYLLILLPLGSIFWVGYLRASGMPPVPVSVLLLEPILSLNLMLGVRGAVRVLWKLRRTCQASKSLVPKTVLIVGAGDAGDLIVRSMLEDPEVRLKPIGFVDDDQAKWGQRIHGIPVYGPIHDIAAVLEKRSVDQVLIAIPTLLPQRFSEIVHLFSGRAVELTMLPSLSEIISSGVTTKAIRKIRVEDLLERTPVRVDMEEIAQYTHDLRILVTGAGGSIGSELCRQLVTLRPKQLILLGNEENSIYWIDQELRAEYGYSATPVIADIKDRHRLDEIFDAHQPEVVFHAAAHKHVPLMESSPHEAIKNNVFGTRHLAELSVAHGVRAFVMISTDKAVNPTSVMGASKRVAEKIVQSLAQRIEAGRSGEDVTEMWGFDDIHPASAVTRFSSVRFGNVLGSNGSVIPTMQKQIERGGPVTVTHENMVRFFMTIPEAVQLVIQAGAMGQRGEIFVLDMGKPVRIMDLAHNLVRLSGFIPEVDIPIKVTGIRPGEKLFEEVLTAEEGVTTTSHEKIRVARSSPVDHALLERQLNHLFEAVRRSDAPVVLETLQWIVPSFQHNVCLSGDTECRFQSHTSALQTVNAASQPTGPLA